MKISNACIIFQVIHKRKGCKIVVKTFTFFASACLTPSVIFALHLNDCYAYTTVHAGGSLPVPL